MHFAKRCMQVSSLFCRHEEMLRQCEMPRSRAGTGSNKYSKRRLVVEVFEVDIRPYSLLGWHTDSRGKRRVGLCETL
jgi:hypothetical protein